jgi:hypothetical protein
VIPSDREIVPSESVGRARALFLFSFLSIYLVVFLNVKSGARRTGGPAPEDDEGRSLPIQNGRGANKGAVRVPL